MEREITSEPTTSSVFLHLLSVSSLLRRGVYEHYDDGPPVVRNSIALMYRRLVACRYGPPKSTDQQLSVPQCHGVCCYMVIRDDSSTPTLTLKLIAGCFSKVI